MPETIHIYFKKGRALTCGIFFLIVSVGFLISATLMISMIIIKINRDFSNSNSAIGISFIIGAMFFVLAVGVAVVSIDGIRNGIFLIRLNGGVMEYGDRIILKRNSTILINLPRESFIRSKKNIIIRPIKKKIFGWHGSVIPSWIVD